VISFCATALVSFSVPPPLFVSEPPPEISPLSVWSPVWLKTSEPALLMVPA
jgi:hypothetical protein